MTRLIHQGKFRERANRTSRYQQSENRQAHLKERNYAQTTHGESSQQNKHNKLVEL